METGILIPILVPIAFFTCIVLVVQIIIKATSKERLALIEKGADMSFFNKQKREYSSLSFGLFIVGCGIGLLVGYLLQAFTPMPPVTAYFSMTFLFGGLSMILDHFLNKKNKQN